VGRRLESIYGWSAAEAVGRRTRELLATTFPVPLAEIEAELASAAHGRASSSGSIGRRRLVVGSQWTLHRGAAGDGGVGRRVQLDLTGAKQAQAMIEEREARLRSILEAAPDAIITIDERGLMQSFSDAAEKLFGYCGGEVIGRNVSMLMSAPSRRA
jgi:two-component system sensor kinase FixL